MQVDGLDATRDAEAVRRRLGVLPDARGVYKRLTARENIAYFGRLHGMSEADIARRTRKSLSGFFSSGLPALSVAIAIAPPSASISLTR